MGKNPKFWVRIRLGFFGDKGSLLFGSEYFLKRFVFGSSSVNLRFGFGFGSGFSSTELEIYFRSGHLLQINCNYYKYQLIDLIIIRLVLELG